MPKATDKHPSIDAFLKSITGRDRPNSVALSLCVICGKKAEGFRDAISAREYSISGMCQPCQDSVFRSD